jgi:hypothetical protein
MYFLKKIVVHIIVTFIIFNYKFVLVFGKLVTDNGRFD